jgi:hypothetical protein
MFLNEVVCCSSSVLPCEDVYGFRHAPTGLSMWVIDGATSIAREPRQYCRTMSDSAWFARAVSQGIYHSVAFHPLTPVSVASIIGNIRAQYLSRCDSVPIYDYPLAAAIYIHVSRHPSGFIEVHTLKWADCFSVLFGTARHKLLPDQSRIAGSFPCTATSGPLQLSELELLNARLRREEQTVTGDGQALTLRIASAFDVAISREFVRGPSILLLGSDGFERLWRLYGIRTMGEVFRNAASSNLLAEMCRLREWETNLSSTITESKRIDDATVMSCFLGIAPMRPHQRLLTRVRSRTIQLLRRL